MIIGFTDPTLTKTVVIDNFNGNIDIKGDYFYLDGKPIYRAFITDVNTRLHHCFNYHSK